MRKQTFQRDLSPGHGRSEKALDAVAVDIDRLQGRNLASFGRMTTSDANTIHIVDDDRTIRAMLLHIFESRGLLAQAWSSAEAFLADYRDDMAGCLLLDVYMAGMTGLQLFEQLQSRDCQLPVIFLTGQAKIQLAVTTLQHGAIDFLEKPIDPDDLVGRVGIALEIDAKRRRDRAARAVVEENLRKLTPREREIVEHIVAGTRNKVIAAKLGIEMRTVEIHRERAFKKMGVKSAAQLAHVLVMHRAPKR